MFWGKNVPINGFFSIIVCTVDWSGGTSCRKREYNAGLLVHLAITGRKRAIVADNFEQIWEEYSN